MSLETYFAFLVAAVVLIIIPGPTNMVVVSSALRYRFQRTIWTILGAAVSHTFFFCVASLGIATVLLASAKLFEIVKWIGVGYLIWLGIGQIRAKQNLLSAVEERVSGNAWSMFLRGFAVNTTNPKALIFYSSFFPPFINSTAPVGPQLVIMGITFVNLFLLIAIAHAYSAAKASEFFKNPRQLRKINQVSGTILLGAGALLAFTSRD